ncbi:MAG: SpoIVB peptidase [Clostridia bacterium]|nr:SpoIVB peptidase [Clostridia bacterium]
MNEQTRRAAGIVLSALIAAANYSPWIRAAVNLPDALVLSCGQTISLETGLPMRARVTGGAVQALADGAQRLDAISMSAVDGGEASVTFSLLGLIPVHETKVSVLEEKTLIPGGQAVGVALHTDGVLVVGGEEKKKSPLRQGDVIMSVQGERVRSAKELSERITAADSDVVTLGVLRGETELSIQASTPPDGSDGKRRLGVWVRDSTAGVGTLSYIDPQTNAYGALGHAIVDGDTGSLLSITDGAIMQARIVGVTKGEAGRAGELRGSFLSENIQIGSLETNTNSGVYGSISALPASLVYPEGLPIATGSAVKEGPATIISTVDTGGPREYEIEIVRCYAQAQDGQKDMLIRVTDEALIEKTGGIVQGMSGSPIIQDGKLVGAVTHVLVNDPTRGYGIFIENMLDAAG